MVKANAVMAEPAAQAIGSSEVCENARSILREFAMPQDASRLIWIDMEMTGLKPDTDRIIEVALVVTDGDLDTVAEAPVWVVRQPDAVLAAMDAWNQGTHGRSGLIDKVKASTRDEATVEARRRSRSWREHVPAKALADVRQLDLPGPALPRALDARRWRTISTTATWTSRR